MKFCSKCLFPKVPSEFYAGRRECKECTKRARRRFVAANRAKVYQQTAAYRLTEAGQAAIRKSYLKRLKTTSHLEYQRAWALTPQGAASRRRRVNKFSRTSLGIAANKRRRAARRGRHLQIENTLTASQWAAILKSHRNRCAYCHQKFSDEIPATQDHIIPISKGGHHTKENVVPACKPCNSSKGNQLWPKLSSKRTKCLLTCSNTLSPSRPIA